MKKLHGLFSIMVISCRYNWKMLLLEGHPKKLFLQIIFEGINYFYLITIHCMWYFTAI